jgi:hypothetical protein
MSLLPTKNVAADKWIQKAIEQHQLFAVNFQKAKECALNAGFFFLQAQTAADHGDFGALIERYKDKISSRTVYRYIEFAAEVIEWVKAEYPGITNDKVAAIAMKMVLKSPKGYIALCRQLELMRKFGEYDEVKYRSKKLLGDGKPQLEFSFDELSASVDVFSKIGQENFFLKFPEGKDETEALGELEAKLETALARVREIKQHGRIIEA